MAKRKKCKKYEVKIFTKGGVISTTPVNTIKEGREYIKDYKGSAKRLGIKIGSRKFSVVKNRKC